MQIRRTASQNRFWEKSETIMSPRQPDRMAKIRLPAKQAKQMRRNHGCKHRALARNSNAFNNNETMIGRATIAIARTRQ
jgi:hypothetical protein